MAPLDRRLPRFAIYLVAAWILCAVPLFRPFWGLMDDAHHLFLLLPKIEADGLFTTAWNYGLNDLQWGMFRPAYPPMVYALYRPGLVFGPWVTFFLNSVFALFCVWLCSSAISKITKTRLDWVLLGTAAFFYEYDLLQHPSLQEKLVLLSGSLLLFLSCKDLSLPKFLRWPLIAAAMLFGICAKASFMIYFSMAFWAFFSLRREDLFERKSLAAWGSVALYAAAGVGALAFFAYISSKGQYTQQYSLAKVPRNLLSADGALFLAPLFLFVIWMIKEPRLFLRQPELLTAFWGVAAFLVLFSPWGIQAYVQSVIGPIYACLCIQLAEGLFRRLPAWIWQLPLALLALATAAYRMPTMYLRLHDIGRAVEAAPSWESAGIQQIYMPCAEGTSAFGDYVREFGRTKITTSPLGDLQFSEGAFVFFDRALCPLPGRAAELPGCAQQKILFEGSLKKSFQLVRASGCSR